MLIGCSFTDPVWQTEVPWSIHYSETTPCYIVAKAGMGIKGICTEGLYFLKQQPSIKKVIVLLPTLWRLDIEMDKETYLCNAMIDLITADKANWTKALQAERKWITSGGLNYDKNTEQAKIFDLMFKHQGFLVIAKEHIRALQNLMAYCKINDIAIHVSAIQDPLKQFNGLEYIIDDVTALLSDVEYNSWFRFNGEFVDEFLGHTQHPTTEEHKILCKHIIKETYHGN